MQMHNSNSFSALIADSQPLVAAGLESLLTDTQGIEVVGKISKGGELVHYVETFQPSLLIADYNLPGFISLDDIRNAMSVSPKTNVLILSSDNNKASILEALQLGVKGYVTKECSLNEVGMAVQSTAKGEKFFCHKILDVILEKHLKVESVSEASLLTTRETEILEFLAHGHSTLSIADKLFLSPHTVQTHRKSIIRKLNIKSPTEFVIYAIDLGLLKIR
jgi:two-component system, NarL family, invasion response regulator UvrY